ncbi:MAG: Crp/Fnr family transcriptional regulator [Reichenbachiella sp.]
MTDEIKRHIGQFLPLDNEDLDTFLSKFKSISLKKGDLFIQEGKKCAYIGFVVKGCLMCVYYKEGNEIIDEFSLENEFIADYKNFIDHQPAEKDVKCIEDAELLVVKHQDLSDLYAQKHSYERVGRLIAESLFKNWHDKAVSLVMDDAKTRYEKLIKNRVSLPQRVPQYLIASYLGITPQSLSRIRKEK